MLKEKIELCIERLADKAPAQRDHALSELKKELASATSSITSVPKPLKFLSPHYARMKELLEQQSDAALKVSFQINQLLLGSLCRPCFCHRHGGRHRGRQH